jgi:hypothetical protein
VDDGSEGNFGTEIELRGQFEACACVVDTKDSEKIAQLMDSPNEKGSVLGWEGVRKEPKDSQSDADQVSRSESGGLGTPRAPGAGGSPDDHAEKGLAICLCFEGGPGTIGTVQVRAPAVLIEGRCPEHGFRRPPPRTARQRSFCRSRCRSPSHFRVCPFETWRK